MPVLTEADITEAEILDRHIEPDSARYQLFLPAELVYFRGHFPDHPVLPGVVQLRWAIALAKPLGVAADFDTLERLKFTRPMVPGMRLTLSLSVAGAGDIRFRYHDAGGDFSSGRLRNSAS